MSNTLTEGYLANLGNYPKDEIKIVVTRTAKSVLSPSWQLLNDYKTKKITWQQYEERFKNEILSEPKAIAKIRQIKELAKTRNIRLICYEKNYPCHRFILLEMINQDV